MMIRREGDTRWLADVDVATNTWSVHAPDGREAASGLTWAQMRAFAAERGVHVYCWVSGSLVAPT